MLNRLRKKKYTLKDIISDKFTDIHSHVVPGIDDGAKNIEASLALLNRIEKNLGIKNMIPSPHTMELVWNNTIETINNAFDNLKEEASDEIDLKYPISEYLLDDHFMELLDKKEILSIKGKYVLVELPFGGAPINLYDMLFKVQLAGYTPILAHPERYFYFHKNISEIQKIKDAGCLLQINLLSLTSYYGKDIQKFGEKLLQQNLIDFVGTDIHHDRHIDYLEKKFISKKNLPHLKSIIENNEMFY